MANRFHAVDSRIVREIAAAFVGAFLCLGGIGGLVSAFGSDETLERLILGLVFIAAGVSLIRWARRSVERQRRQS